MKKFFKKHFRYGQKGFTLIELLVVIAILGVLAAVVVPNVSKFMGKGKDEAGLTELHNVQTAVTGMMADNDPPLSSVNVTASTAPTQTMSAFPVGEPLYGGATNYIQKSTTEYWYSVDADGTVHGWWVTGGSSVANNVIGNDPAP